MRRKPIYYAQIPPHTLLTENRKWKKALLVDRVKLDFT